MTRTTCSADPFPTIVNQIVAAPICGSCASCRFKKNYMAVKKNYMAVNTVAQVEPEPEVTAATSESAASLCVGSVGHPLALGCDVFGYKDSNWKAKAVDDLKNASRVLLVCADIYVHDLSACYQASA